MTKNTIKRRMQQHMTDANTIQSLKITQVMNKLGTHNFHIEAIDIANNRDEAEKLERQWISKLNTIYPNGYNVSAGGICLKGEENPFYGKTHTTETLNHLSNIASQRVGKLNSFYGKQHSEETKAKISEANKGKKHSTHTKDYLSLINQGTKNPFYGKTHSTSTKMYLSQLRITKNIQMLSSDGKVLQSFDTMREAVEYIKQTGKSSAKDKSIASAISKAIRHGNKSYKYNWKTIESS